MKNINKRGVLSGQSTDTPFNLLTKMIHQMPDKINEIHRLKGKRIPPNFEPAKSPFACKCKICSS